MDDVPCWGQSYPLPPPVALHTLEVPPTGTAFVVADGDVGAVVGGTVLGTALGAADPDPEDAIRVRPPPGPSAGRVRQAEIREVVEETIHGLRPIVPLV